MKLAVPRQRWLVFLAALLAFAAVATAASSQHPMPSLPTAKQRPYEVWAIDQSDTTADGGGTLYIYRRAAVSSRRAARPEVIDLGAETRDFCLARTGSAPRRPHMLMFNHANTHAVVAFVATGHVLFMDARARKPVGCIDVGLQAHDAQPAPSGRYVLVANQNGKLLQRITTNYATNAFELDAAATLNLATCRTPSGAACEDAALRPDNAPIFATVDHSGRLGFITLRGGGMFVVDSTATPIAIVREYDRSAVRAAGFTALQAGEKLYVNSGGGAPATPLGHVLYAFSMKELRSAAAGPNRPAPRLVYDHSSRGFVDSHGMVLTKPMVVTQMRHARARGRTIRRAVRVMRGPYLMVADRGANRIVVVDTRTDRVVNEVYLAGRKSPDPAPDLMAVSPTGDRLFVALRGLNPLTANIANVNNAIGSTPGVAVMRVERQGRTCVLEKILRISRIVEGFERADPHVVAVRPT
jgi:DNA-binding beta-propeller fold protein YncE